MANLTTDLPMWSVAWDEARCVLLLEPPELAWLSKLSDDLYWGYAATFSCPATRKHPPLDRAQLRLLVAEAKHRAAAKALSRATIQFFGNRDKNRATAKAFARQNACRNKSRKRVRLCGRSPN